MSSLSKTRVNYVNKATGVTYVYESVSFWDKGKKQSRNKRVCLARVYRNAFENDRFSLGNFEISLYYPFSTSAMSKSSASFFCRGVIRFNVNSV